MSKEKSREKKKETIGCDRKVTIPDEFVHERWSFIFFFFFLFRPFVPFSRIVSAVSHYARCIFKSQRCLRCDSIQLEIEDEEKKK